MNNKKQIFRELEQLFTETNPEELHKIARALTVEQLDALIEGFIEKYGEEDEVVLFYKNKREELFGRMMATTSIRTS